MERLIGNGLKTSWQVLMRTLGLAENSQEVEAIEIDPEAAHNEGQAAPSNIASGEGGTDKDEGEVQGEEVGDTSTGQMKYPKAGEAI